MKFLPALFLLLPFVWLSPIFPAAGQAPPAASAITTNDVIVAEKLFGLDLPEDKLKMMLPGLRAQQRDYAVIRQLGVSNSVLPAVLFNPIPAGMTFQTKRLKPEWSPAPKLAAPANLDDAAFYSVGQLAALIKSRQVTSTQLTRMYLDRLKKYGPKLNCVVTLMEDSALAQARRADQQIAAGKYRGPLHGIPYGVKDLLATKGTRTTWGGAPYTNQMFDDDATVVKRLNAAGAVLLAKLSLGELAMGDVWFGGQTRNPWDPVRGSSGSSAGPAAATSAGLVAFSVGSETRGSIVSPCTVCGVTGLRPTYGRVSRTGAMSLSWTMDKLGPICRTVEDCALVFNAILGPDGIDPTLYDLPFNYKAKVDLSKLRIGYLKSAFERSRGKTNDLAALEKLRSLGANLIPLELPKYPKEIDALLLEVEAAAAFDDLTRSGQDAQLASQQAWSWPNSMRQARFVPAVEYLRAQQVRAQLIQQMAACLKNIDVYVTPTMDDNDLGLTNLTGHPQVVVPDGFSNGLPTSISFVGQLFGEAGLLAVAKAYQDATGFHLQHPKLAE
ncbi:MAG: amidase [Verrucomicrobiota bacterium]|jgi:Asp-tRNA(Asn)/Glu-tRNA(Gln) amidotransferase A subunit family amidase